MDRVEILMSTHNGEAFIEKQIESIMKQRNVDIHLTVRDDGSTDKTLEIIERLQIVYPGRIVLFCGKNLGYRKSFLQLLDLAQEADYYGFADQDDFWKENKVYRAIECLRTLNDGVRLYAGSLEIANSNMQKIGDKDISGIPNTLGSLFTRNRLAGCTFLFSKSCKELAQRFSGLDYPPGQMPAHDFVVAACAYACGSVYLDNMENIIHIRHNGSVTSGGNGLKKRILVEWKNVFFRKRGASTLAAEMLKRCENELSDGGKMLLQTIAAYRTGFMNQFRFLFDKRMTCGSVICDMEQKLKVFLGIY